jgi:hypothetical protein
MTRTNNASLLIHNGGIMATKKRSSQKRELIDTGRGYEICKAFNNYRAGSLTFGVDGGAVARVVDLGNADELTQRYWYKETVGKGQGFASLRVQNGRVVILKDHRSQAVQDVRELASQFLEGVPSVSATIS